MTDGPREQTVPESAIPSLVPEYRVLNGDFEGNRVIAVVGEPFAGREQVLNHVANRLGARQFRLDPETDPAAVVALIEDAPVVIGGCQHLYRRAIGGFEGLETVLNALARTTETVVTGWNSSAWSYLDATRDIGGRFHTYELDSLAGEDLGEFIQGTESESPSFLAEDTESMVGLQEVSLGWRDLTIPVPAVHSSALRRRFTPRIDPETAVYERLATITNGNLGVALALWHHKKPKVDLMPGDFSVPSLDVNREAAFLLRRILSRETASRAHLADQFGNEFEQLVNSLATSNVVADDGEYVSLEPAGVPAAMKLAKAERIL